MLRSPPSRRGIALRGANALMDAPGWALAVLLIVVAMALRWSERLRGVLRALPRRRRGFEPSEVSQQ
jgi:hypothetical protein